MSRKKISTTIYVTPEQNERLKLLHERTKVPVAVYIREGIDLVLERFGHLLPGQLPLDAQMPRSAPPPSLFAAQDEEEERARVAVREAPTAAVTAHAAAKK